MTVSSQYDVMVGIPTSLSASSSIRQTGANDRLCPFLDPLQLTLLKAWAEHKRKQAQHKLGLILYMWHKRGLNPYMEALPG